MELEGFELLGNATLVPIVIFLTQLLKQHINFKYSSDAVALAVSFALCVGYEFYILNPEEAYAVIGLHAAFKFIVDGAVTGFATWLASSKIYDLGHGNKKRSNRKDEEKRILEEEVTMLRNGSGNGDITDEDTEEDSDLSQKLSDILERI